MDGRAGCAAPHPYRSLHPCVQETTRAMKEQELSGICSSRCFIALNGPDG